MNFANFHTIAIRGYLKYPIFIYLEYIIIYHNQYYCNLYNVIIHCFSSLLFMIHYYIILYYHVILLSQRQKNFHDTQYCHQTKFSLQNYSSNPIARNIHYFLSNRSCQANLFDEFFNENSRKFPSLFLINHIPSLKRSLHPLPLD